MLIRRSNLLIPLGDEKAVADAWRHHADAVTLDPAGVELSGERLAAAIGSAGKGGAEVFLKIEPARLDASLEAAARGLAGFVLPRVETAEQVARAEAIAAKLGPLDFIVLVESARAVWDICAILAASRRISQAALVERSLAASLGIGYPLGFDPCEHAFDRRPAHAQIASNTERSRD